MIKLTEEEKKARNRARTMAWKAANPDKVKANSAKYREKHKDKIREFHANYRAENKEKISEKNAEWRKANPDKVKAFREQYKAKINSDHTAFKLHAYCHSKAASKRRKIDWDLSIEEYLSLVGDNPICRFSGEKLLFSTNTKNRISLDRIDSNKGYTKNNVQIVSSRVNIAKNTQTDEEFIAMCEAVVKHQKKLVAKAKREANKV